MQETGEPGLANWTIDLYISSGTLPGVLYQTTTTDQSGNYSFTVPFLPAGENYVVTEVQQTGWQQTAPALGTSGTAQLTNGLIAYVDPGTAGSVYDNQIFGDYAAITPQGIVFVVLKGQTYNGVVATFTDPDLADTAGDFTATIDWGDDTALTPGVISGGDGSFTVTGSHSYLAEDSYALAVQIERTTPTISPPVPPVVAADLGVVLSPGNDPSLITVMNPAVSYSGGIGQTATYGPGTFAIDASGTVDFTFTEAGSGIYANFDYTQSVAMTFSLTESGSTGPAFATDDYSLSEAADNTTTTQDQGFTRFGSFTDIESGSGTYNMTETCDLPSGDYTISEADTSSNTTSETGTYVTGGYGWTVTAGDQSTLLKTGNYISEDYSLSETNTQNLTRVESGTLVQFPSEVTGTTPEQAFWMDPDTLMQMNFNGTPLPNYDNMPLNPGKAAPHGPRHGQRASRPVHADRSGHGQLEHDRNGQ